MHDLVIRGATVVDGLGHDPIRADVAVAKGRIAAIGDDRQRRGRDDRCRRPRVDAGHHRYPYPLRRAGDLGPNAVAVALPRCHDRCDRELRVRHRAFAAASARPDHAQSRGRRGHGPRRPARRHRLAVRVLLRVSGRGAPRRTLCKCRGTGRSLGGAHRRHGRGRLDSKGAGGGRTGRDEAARRRRRWTRARSGSARRIRRTIPAGAASRCRLRSATSRNSRRWSGRWADRGAALSRLPPARSRSRRSPTSPADTAAACS